MYYMYRQYFPLLALTTYAKAAAAAQKSRCASPGETVVGLGQLPVVSSDKSGSRRSKGSFDSSLRSSLRMTPKK